MTKEDAIKVLRTESIELGGAAPSVCRFLEALDMAVKALVDDNHFREDTKKVESICGWTGLPCCHCNPGACSNRRYGHA